MEQCSDDGDEDDGAGFLTRPPRRFCGRGMEGGTRRSSGGGEVEVAAGDWWSPWRSLPLQSRCWLRTRPYSLNRRSCRVRRRCFGSHLGFGLGERVVWILVVAALSFGRGIGALVALFRRFQGLWSSPLSTKLEKRTSWMI